MTRDQQKAFNREMGGTPESTGELAVKLVRLMAGHTMREKLGAITYLLATLVVQADLAGRKEAVEHMGLAVLKMADEMEAEVIGRPKETIN
jgi:hypothetical protein